MPDSASQRPICLVCEPRHFRITRPINAVQVANRDRAIDTDRAMEQHRALGEELAAVGFTVEAVEPIAGCPYQVFVRDLAIGHLEPVVLARPREPIRRPEVEAVRVALDRLDVGWVEPPAGYLEGGDLVGWGDELFVGVGDRTDADGAAWVGERFAAERRVRRLEVEPGHLHLDVVFNVVDDTTCVACPEGLSSASLARLRERFDEVLELTAPERLAMSTNFLHAPEAILVARNASPRVVRRLEATGRPVRRLGFDEIQVAGGSLRCATCPIGPAELGPARGASPRRAGR